MGIDYLARFLTDNYTIREVLAFPFMEDDKSEQKKEKLAAEAVGIEPLPVEGIGKSSSVTFRDSITDSQFQDTSKYSG